MSENTAREMTETEERSGDSIAPRAVDWANPRVAAILNAAAKCFARKGFSATTLAEIGKELGLRKSIVHYYFASKAALIHEVQSFTYNKYLERVREVLSTTKETSQQGRAMDALRSLWETRSSTNVGLNIEVWSASRNDPELRRRAAALLSEKRRLVGEGISDALGDEAVKKVHIDALSTLILSVLDGLSVASYIEGDSAKTEEAYRLFLYLLRLGVEQLDPSAVAGPPPAANNG
ncbi:MAG TPA: TetR/AcrR family transcriptional regulator [Polyangiaceae bacterium]|jgi:AcrR family transcriptional regulator|nr:TetR/AcrR family transcriptional regulator [Polyangiaceae bacterium]